jgi:hypothetical protein
LKKRFEITGDARIRYIHSQKDYFKFFSNSYLIKNDPDLYDYRRKLKSEIQLVILKRIHSNFLAFGVVYGIVRLLKSGRSSALI